MTLPPTAAAAAKKGAGFRDYPFLTHEEFAEVCHEFDRIYRQATLGPLRRRWRVSVCAAFNTSFATGPGSEYTTYLQITRPLENSAGPHDDELSGQLGRFSFGAAHGGEHAHGDDDLEDQAMAMAEDADEAALPPPPAPSYGYVSYEVHLHPTYRAPCLWFQLHGLPNDEPAFSIDTVFRRLVPAQYQDSMRSAGPIGGISADVSLSGCWLHSILAFICLM